MQDVAFVELQVSIEVPPLAIWFGLALNMTVGWALADTVTVAVTAAVVPPGPVQVSEYEVSAVNAPVDCVPLVGNEPLQPPDAVQEVAFVELQVKLVLPPGMTDDSIGVNIAVGAGGAGVTGTDPDPPQAANSSAAAGHIEYNDRIKFFASLGYWLARRDRGKPRVTPESPASGGMENTHDIIRDGPVHLSRWLIAQPLR